MYRKSISFLLSICLILSSGLTFAQSDKGNNKKIDLKSLALPSDIGEVVRASGNIFYSPTKRGSVLIPVHIWGQVRKAGLHFLPLDTAFLRGISIAGGPDASADLSDVHLVRGNKGNRKELIFDLTEGGDEDSREIILEPNDSIYIPKDTFFEDRAYYTSLIGVVATIISSIFIIETINDN